MTAPESTTQRAVPNAEAIAREYSMQFNRAVGHGVLTSKEKELLVGTILEAAAAINEAKDKGRLTGRQLAAKHGFKQIPKEDFDDNVAAYTGGPSELEAAAIQGGDGQTTELIEWLETRPDMAPTHDAYLGVWHTHQPNYVEAKTFTTCLSAARKLVEQDDKP